MMRYPYELPVLQVRDSGNGTVQVNRGQGWSDPFRPAEGGAVKSETPSASNAGTPGKDIHA